MGPARRRTRRFIADFYSDTDGFVIDGRDYAFDREGLKFANAKISREFRAVTKPAIERRDMSFAIADDR